MKKYPFIQPWGTLMGSYGYYIAQQVNAASVENAPVTAIYRNNLTEGWRTIEDVTSEETRHYFRVNHADLLEQYKVSWR